MTRPLLAVALLLALVGCGVPASVSAPQSQPQPTQSQPVGVIPAPAAVSIPAIGVYGGIVPLGLNADGTMAVPPITEPLQASYYRNGDDDGVIPGETGPAVVAAHVSGRTDGVSVPGLFARLAELEPGDTVTIERVGADPLQWVVVRVERHPKDDFPTADVFGNASGPELVLITCGGALGTADDGSRSYSDNVIVWAVLA